MDKSLLYHVSLLIFGSGLAISELLTDRLNSVSMLAVGVGTLLAMLVGWKLYNGSYKKRDPSRKATYLIVAATLLVVLMLAVRSFRYLGVI